VHRDTRHGPQRGKQTSVTLTEDVQFALAADSFRQHPEGFSSGTAAFFDIDTANVDET